MLVRVPGVLSTDQLRLLRGRLDATDAPWVDGRATAGHQGARVKHNRQIAEDSDVARELGTVVIAELERNPLFLSATLPVADLPAAVQSVRGGGGDALRHARRRRRAPRCPGAARSCAPTSRRRSSCRVPDDYDGGELQIDDTYGTQRIKLPAGDLVLYPATSLHRVTPVTRGARVACFFWVQSMVRDDAQRALLFDLDMAVVKLTRDAPDHESLVSLTGCYHNLLRMWARAMSTGRRKGRKRRTDLRAILGPASPVARPHARRRWRIHRIVGQHSRVRPGSRRAAQPVALRNDRRRCAARVRRLHGARGAGASGDARGRARCGCPTATAVRSWFSRARTPGRSSASTSTRRADRVLDVSAGSDLVNWLHAFHESLQLRDYGGRSIVGAIGIAMLISALTGLYLWWPLRGLDRAAFGFRAGFAASRNLHYTFGFYGSIMLGDAVVHRHLSRLPRRRPRERRGVRERVALAARRAGIRVERDAHRHRCRDRRRARRTIRALR